MFSCFHKNVSLPQNSWIYFFIFLLTNTLLSYFPLPGNIKLVVVLAGIILPLVAAFGWVPLGSAEQPIPWKKPNQFVLPWWCWSSLLILACLPRLAQLTTLSTWPTGDDGLYCYYAMELAKKWDWKFFFSYAQVPPLTQWLLALFFKIFPPSLFSLWFFPGLVSIFTVIVAWFNRRFFFDYFSFMLLALFSFSFPFLYTAKFCVWYVIILFWTVLAFTTLIQLLRSSTPAALFLSAFGLGMVVGIGFFTGAAWPVVALCVISAVIGPIKQKGPQTIKILFSMALPLFFFTGIFFFLSWKLNNGVHVKHIWAFSPDSDWAASITEGFLKWASLFWAASPPNCFGPLWGGMLNPILDTGFFLGILKCIQYRRQGFFQWILFSLILFSLPGFLAQGFEIFRMTQIFPLLVFISCLGWFDLFFRPGKFSSWKSAGMVLLLLASITLDLYHLEGPYHRLGGTPGPAWNHLKLIQYWRAYGILEKINKEKGPGMILSEFRPEIGDQTLTIATYSFNAARNNRIPFSEARWAALLVHPDYRQFLSKAFPTGHWYWLEQNEMLGVIPVDPFNIQTLRSWYEFNRRLQPITSQTFDLFMGESKLPIIRQLLEIEPTVKSDPFLMTCLWEKVAFHRVSIQDSLGALQAFQQAIKKGFPVPHLYYLEGSLLTDMGRFAEARSAFQKAVLSPYNSNSAWENIKILDRILRDNHKQPQEKIFQDKPQGNGAS